MIEFISATREDEEGFWRRTPLGLSLRRIRHHGELVPHIAFRNTRGLPEIYNARILADDSPEWLVFVHDDVWLEDMFVLERIEHGLRRFDVIGVVGNRRIPPGHIGWCFNGEAALDSPAFLSGRIAHGKRPLRRVSNFGPTPTECALLDGVFLGVRKSALRDAGILFDPRFDFHFYDLDFCRCATAAGLQIGTWPIALTHQSTGEHGYNSPAWLAGLGHYREKYGHDV